jgi:branched-chain amino acid transport system substrate-binding protein
MDQSRSRIRTVVVLVAVALAATLIAGLVLWRHKPPVLVGFVGQLTGKQMELGIQERNGVQLAVDTINAAGGIGGRAITLLVRDDQGTPDKAREVDRELVGAGVVAIIGHPTTAQSLAGMEVTNPAKVVLLSPTVSSPVVSGKDDWFFRIYPSFKDSAQAFADYVLGKVAVSRLAIILDTDNGGYTKTYEGTFRERYQASQGVVTAETTFSSKTQPDFGPLLADLRASQAQGLLIIASDIDTALIAQRARLLGWSLPLFTSAWAQTETLLNNGGRAIEGMKIEQSYALTSQAPSFLEFRRRYEARYGTAPSFGAAFGYEAAQALAEALRRTGGEARGLKESLLRIKDFQGLMDTFSFDAFGDVNRPFYLSEIRDGKFVPVAKLKAGEPGSR